MVSRRIQYRVALVATCLLAACHDSTPEHAIPETRQVSGADKVLDMPEDLRFGGPHSRGQAEPPPATDAGPQWDWQTPEGWEVLPPSPMAEILLQLKANSQVQCAFRLHKAQEVAAVVNHWRAQVGLQPLAPEQVAALPKQALLSGQGTLVEAQGEKGALVGVYRALPMAGIAVLAQGPAEVLQQERERILAFAASIRMQGMPEQEPASQTPAPSKDRFQFELPAGWVPGRGSSMRLATFDVQDGDGAQCWLTLLKQDGGGLAANLNRWLGEVGQPALNPEDLAQLPDVQVLGQDCKLLQATGPYQGMGGPKLERATLLGVVVPLEEETLFIKMVGPEEVMREQKAKFQAFCTSLKAGK